MEALYVLVPLGLLVALAAGVAFWAAAEDGQFDDLESPGRAIVEDLDSPGRAAVEDDRPGDTASKR